MDQFAQHLEASRLLAGAAYALSGNVRKLQHAFPSPGKSPKVKPLTDEMFRLIQAALQLTAAADGICQQAASQSTNDQGAPSSEASP